MSSPKPEPFTDCHASPSHCSQWLTNKSMLRSTVFWSLQLAEPIRELCWNLAACLHDFDFLRGKFCFPQKNSDVSLPCRLSKLDTDARSVITVWCLPLRLGAFFFFFVNICQIKCCVGFCWFLWSSLWSNPQILWANAFAGRNAFGKELKWEITCRKETCQYICEDFHEEARTEVCFIQSGTNSTAIQCWCPVQNEKIRIHTESSQRRDSLGEVCFEEVTELQSLGGTSRD